MSNTKPDHNRDDGLTKEYTKNKKNMWTDSDLEDCVGIQSSVWCFQTSSKSKVKKTEIGMELEEVCTEIWQQTNIFRA